MRYLTIAMTIGLAGITSGCTTSGLGSVTAYVPGYVYTGYGPANMETGAYGFSPRATIVRDGRLPARDHTGR